MKIIMNIFAMVLAFALSITPAHAEANAKLFYGMITEGGEARKLASIALGGYFNAYLWANAYNENVMAPKIYCQPENLALQLDQEIDIYMRYLESNSKDMDVPVGIVVMKALVATFPCK